MRIAVWYNLPSGGAKRALYNHVQGLVERGHTVEIFRPPTRQESYLPLGEFGAEHVVPLTEVAVGGDTRLARWKSFNSYITRLVDAHTAHAQECAEQINGGKFDLLFANTDEVFHAPFVGRFVKGLPKVLYLQEPNRPLYEFNLNRHWTAKPEGQSLKGRLVDHIDTRIVRVMAREEIANAAAFDRILVNSFFSREAVLKAYGLDARVCYLGVDTSKFVNMGVPRYNVVVGIGTFGPSKNIRLVLEAIGTISEGNRPLLTWIGNLKEDRYYDELIARAKELNVDYRPKLLVTDNELIETLNRCKLMAYAPRLEPFGFAPIEANACGLPVVGVAEGGVRETVTDGVNGLLVDHDPIAMGRAIEALLTNEPLRSRLAQTGEQRAKEIWNIDASNERLERHLLEVMETNG